MDKISPCLWFDGQAEAAVDFYLKLFKDRSRLLRTLRWGEHGHGVPGSVLTLEFELAGRSYIALNGGPQYKFTPAVSLSIDCADQAEVDRCWDALCDGGQPVQCGWLTDRFGLSWQVVPRQLPELLRDPDPARAGRAMQAMMGMVKLDIAALQRAADGP
ncbi:MAG: VOC family protein [Burkholderiaceae bacterium]